MAIKPWYLRYHELREEVVDLEAKFADVCDRLGGKKDQVLSEVLLDVVSHTVRESNLQEGISLDANRTRELTEVVFSENDRLSGAHIDFDQILDAHRRHVVTMCRNGSSDEEIAAYNLARSHLLIMWIRRDLALRSMSWAISCTPEIWSRCGELLARLSDARGRFAESSSYNANAKAELDRITSEVDAELRAMGPEIVTTLRTLSKKWDHDTPINVSVNLVGDVVTHLLDLSQSELRRPFQEQYLHLLHRITLMGIVPWKKLGQFRDIPVHVGNPDILFPAPSLLPGMMKEYCDGFPRLHDPGEMSDPIMRAAEVSYRFVRIHPYRDGNGRISRVLMNLVLWPHYLPVYLKADKKGRHRYIQSLRRADRNGNLEPLAALIAYSMRNQYVKVLRSLGETVQ